VGAAGRKDFLRGKVATAEDTGAIARTYHGAQHNLNELDYSRRRAM
jgi:hypothetical protein